MAAKKRPAKTSKRPSPTKKVAPPKKKAKPAAPKRAAKRPPPKQASKPAGKKASPAALPKGLPPRAKRLAAFSQQVVKEEEAPVAVRTFNEARAGIKESKRLDVRSGEIEPVTPPKAPRPEPEAPVAATPATRAPKPPPLPQPEADEDLQAEIERDLEAMDMGESRPAATPKVEPLAGRLAVPKRSNPLEEEFQVGPAAKKGKKGAPPTKEEFGKIELRMQRGSKDQPIATASPDYLQRSFNQAAQKGKVAATSATKPDAPAKQDEFEVAMDKGQKRLDKTLTDFGDIEIAQQTRRGSKKLGKLDTDEDATTDT